MTNEKKLSLTALLLFSAGITIAIITRQFASSESLHWIYPVGQITGIFLAFAAVVWSGVNVLLLLKSKNIGKKPLWLAVSALPLLAGVAVLLSV